MSAPDTDLPAAMGASADRGDSLTQRALALVEQSGALIFPLHGVYDSRCACGEATKVRACSSAVRSAALVAANS